MHYKSEQIDQWLSDYEQSNQKMGEYCKDKPFHLSTLRYWIAKKAKEGGFIEVKGHQSKQKERHIESVIQIDYPNGVLLRITTLLTIDDVKKLIK